MTDVERTDTSPVGPVSSADSSDLTRLTAAQLAGLMAENKASAVEVTRAHLDRIAAVDADLHAFLHVDADGAIDCAAAVDARRAAGEALHFLAGVPVAVKDVFTTQGIPTTAGSRILEGWVPPYDAAVIEKIHHAGLIVLGKVNMDEFGMGSSTENSGYGPTRNPWDLTRTPGGTSGGSSAAVAGFQAPLALGTDTGGSIRQPSAFTGLFGHKPTYGAVSRYGLIAYSSSLDQAGPLARTVLDSALLFEVIAGHDDRDSTSVNATLPPIVAAARKGAEGDLSGMTIGVVKELAGEGYDSAVVAQCRRAYEILDNLGAKVIEVSCPSFQYALPAYYLIAPSEASSNLARFDGVRYGIRVGEADGHGLEEVMSLTRSVGFGPEVKRRIILGTYALSSGYYEQYYGQAQKVRTLIARDFSKAFGICDVIVSPTAPTLPFKLGERMDDPMAMYAADLCTLPASLAGVPTSSVPVGLATVEQSDGGRRLLPVGMQVSAPAMADDRCFLVAAAIEAATDGPVTRHAPDVVSPTRG